MKSFLKFFGLTCLCLFLISISAVLFKHNFDDFEEKIVMFTIVYFASICFTYTFIYKEILRDKKEFLKLLITFATLLILTSFLNIISSFYYNISIRVDVILLQSVLAFAILLLLIAVLNFANKYNKLHNLEFLNSKIYYFKLILVLSLFELAVFSILLYSKVDEFNLLILLSNLKKMLFFFLIMNNFSLLCIYFLNTIGIFRKIKILIVVITIIFTLLLLSSFDSFPVFLSAITLLFSSLFVLFSTLFLLLFINSQDNKIRNKIEFEIITNSLSKKEAEYMQLKNQINPHFLFNNLNTLITFIELNPDKAIAFGHNLANVYRHYLKNQTEDFVLLQTEIDFISEYLQIYKAKFESGFDFEIDLESSDYYLLSSCLQEVIDNIFKHNILEEANPIKIKIFIKGEYLVISNSINLKKDPNSIQSGLQNLQKRYEILIQKSVVITCNETSFIIQLPIIKIQ
jgi:sensor histidine kinase YesM